MCLCIHGRLFAISHFPSATKTEPGSIYLSNKFTYFHIESDGKKLKDYYKTSPKLRFLSRGPNEHAVNNTSRHRLAC